MKERPILFSGPMVRAILDDRKTQTRRIVKLPKGCRWCDELGGEPAGWYTDGHGAWNILTQPCRYGVPGDRLWVKETWAELLHTSPAADEPVLCAGDKLIKHATQRPDGGWNYDGKVIAYRATTAIEFCDGDGFSGPDANRDDMPRWRSSRYMPRWASRITLEIVSTRVERLQEISEADSYAEGVTIPPEHAFASNGNPEMRNEARVAYQQLWTSINGPDSWAANPWVYVVEFRMVTA